jgi:hypothetical protein
MQVVENVGGTFLLQETKPIALCGALAIIKSGFDRGWVLGSLVKSAPNFSCCADANAVSISMSFEVAARFASCLLALASQQICQLHEEDTEYIGEIAIDGPPRQRVVRWGSPDGCPDVKVRVEDDVVEVRLRSAFASALAFRILRRIGELSEEIED